MLLQIHKTPVSAEESAASNLLEKLGCPLKLVLDLQGSCKRELEQYVYEMDFSAAYHTIKVKRFMTRGAGKLFSKEEKFLKSNLSF